MICVDVLVTLVAMDPQTWEDCGCDLDLYEEVSEVDNLIMNICLSVSSWAKEIVEACDPYNQQDKFVGQQVLLLLGSRTRWTEVPFS